VTISFGYVFKCVYFNWFCDVWVCVCVDFVMCGCVYERVCNVWVCGFVMCGCVYVWVCNLWVCNVWVCVCVDFVMCGCVYVCIL
jgi:hypothetical protein